MSQMMATMGMPQMGSPTGDASTMDFSQANMMNLNPYLFHNINLNNNTNNNSGSNTN
jgi:hypothetical protein